MGATARVVDLTNVKESSGISKKRMPAGDYAAVITKVEDAVSKKSGDDKTPMYLFTIKLKENSGAVYPYYCVLQENQLWKLRNIFIAAGKTVPKKKLKVDPNTIVGKLIGVTLEDTEHEGKEQSEISGVFPAADLDDSAISSSDEDEPTEDSDDSDDDGDIEQPLAPASVPDEDDEDEPAAEEPAEEDEDEADPYAELDRTELKTRIKAAQPDFRVLKSQTDDDLRAALKKIDDAAKSAGSSSDEEDLTDIDIDDL